MSVTIGVITDIHGNLAALEAVLDEAINRDIGELVKKGRINPRTLKMPDSVPVIGNAAVHPRVLGVLDNRELASFLFSLVNLIMFEAVSHDKYVDGIYKQLPENKRKGIEDRDRPKPEKAG